MYLRPSPDILEVPTCMLGIEVYVRKWLLFIHPYLPQDCDVHGTHELLANNVEAVCYKTISQ